MPVFLSVLMISLKSSCMDNVWLEHTLNGKIWIQLTGTGSTPQFVPPPAGHFFAGFLGGTVCVMWYSEGRLQSWLCQVYTLNRHFLGRYSLASYFVCEKYCLLHTRFSPPRTLCLLNKVEVTHPHLMTMHAVHFVWGVCILYSRDLAILVWREHILWMKLAFLGLW